MHGLPADAREDHICKKKKTGTCEEFSDHMLSKIPAIFKHHQIELASALFWFCYFLALSTD